MNLPEVKFRAIEPSDAALLFDVENDENYWADSDVTTPYSYEIIYRYATSTHSDPLKEGQLRLIAVNCDEEPVGILDFYDISPLHRHALLGIYILPNHRLRGYGKAMVIKAKHYARNILNLRLLGVKVLESNQISQHLFENTGFIKAGVLPDWHFNKGDYSSVIFYWSNL